MKRYEHYGVKPGTYYREFAHFTFSRKKGPDDEPPEAIRVVKEYDRFVLFDILWNHANLGTKDHYRECLSKMLINPNAFYTPEQASE